LLNSYGVDPATRSRYDSSYFVMSSACSFATCTANHIFHFV